MENRKKSKDFSEAGRRLRQLRIALGYDSQQAFAEWLGGFTINRISRAERAETPVPAELLRALVAKGVNANWVLTGEGEMLGSRVPIVGRTSGGELAPELPRDEDLISERIQRLEVAAAAEPGHDEMANQLLLMTARRVVELERQVGEIIRRLREAPQRKQGGEK